MCLYALTRLRVRPGRAGIPRLPTAESSSVASVISFASAEHLGSCENYNLQNYLAIGECDGSLGPDEMYKEAMEAIFVLEQPCHRFPQLRWSKRHPGKYRWVLYEMWPSIDPVSQQKAVLVCEQNISQVKALEEQIKKQNER